MSRLCRRGNAIPYNVMIDGRVRNLQNRKFCLTCSPFGSHNTRDPFRPRADAAAKFRRYQEKARRERKGRLVELLGGKCMVCGYDRCIAALEFHHRDPRTKRFGLSKEYLLRPWREVSVEALKCDLLCANCHRELEERLRQEGDDDPL